MVASRERGLMNDARDHGCATATVEPVLWKRCETVCTRGTGRDDDDDDDDGVDDACAGVCGRVRARGLKPSGPSHQSPEIKRSLYTHTHTHMFIIMYTDRTWKAIVVAVRTCVYTLRVRAGGEVRVCARYAEFRAANCLHIAV